MSNDDDAGDLLVSAITDIQSMEMTRLQRRLNVLHTGQPTVPMDAPSNPPLVLAHHELHRRGRMVFTVDLEPTGVLVPRTVLFVDGHLYTLTQVA